jgi:hypothetical protein
VIAALASEFVISRGDVRFLLAAAMAGMLSIPDTMVFRCNTGWPRLSLAVYSACLALLGTDTILLLFVTLIEASAGQHAGAGAGKTVSGCPADQALSVNSPMDLSSFDRSTPEERARARKAERRNQRLQEAGDRPSCRRWQR